MNISRWKKQIADKFFVTTSDGSVIFFPFGPIRGYLLPKTAFKAIIINSIVWFNVGALGSFAVTAAVGLLLNISMDILLLIGLVDYVHYYFRIRRITRNLVGFPHQLSMRVYASAQDPVRLWEHFWAIALMTTICGVFVFLGPPRLLFMVGLAILFLGACVSGYIIFLNNRLQSVTKT